MGAFARRHFATFLVAFLTALVTAGGPPLAAVVFDADYARNADKVDNIHAVRAGATKAQRAGKLVATNAAGRVPDAETLDGLNSAALQKRVDGQCAGNRGMTAVAADGSVSCALDDVDAAHVVTVGAVGSPTENGSSLRSALARIPASAPTSTSPWLVRIGPGRFDLAGTPLVTRANVHLEGAGTTATVLTCACGGSPTLIEPTLRVAHPIDVRSLSVKAAVSGDDTTATALQVAASARLVDVVAQATGAINAYGMVFNGGAAQVFDGATSASSTGGSEVIALWANGGTVIADGLAVTAGGTTPVFRGGIVTEGNGEHVEITGARIFASSGTTSGGAVVRNAPSNLRIANSMVEGGVAGDALPSACVATYDGLFAPLDEQCRPMP